MEAAGMLASTIDVGGWKLGGDVKAVVEDGVGGAGVSCPDTGVGAFSAMSRLPRATIPIGVFDFTGVFEIGASAPGDGR
jgi:hypothetical protein